MGLLNIRERMNFNAMILEHYSLKALNTFHIDAKSRYFTIADDLTQLRAALEFAKSKNLPIFILGGGSNVLFTKDFKGLAIKNNIKGFDIVKETAEHVWIRIGAGEEWHEAVSRSIDLGYNGVENLSLIPGSVGAAPIQNIGAYGVELCDVFFSLEALEIDSGRLRTFNRGECEFGYRQSVFKNKYKGKFVIVSVTLQLSKVPAFNISYAALNAALQDTEVNSLTAKKISEAVIRIRRSKLPDPQEIGNAGSFFKNPVVDAKTVQEISAKYPDIPGHFDKEGNAKLSAAWLIERCGWKGKRMNDAGVHEKHSLVLVNYGSATGSEMKSLAEAIQDSVCRKFGISLEPEVNFI